MSLDPSIAASINSVQAFAPEHCSAESTIPLADLPAEGKVVAARSRFFRLLRVSAQSSETCGKDTKIILRLFRICSRRSLTKGDRGQSGVTANALDPKTTAPRFPISTPEDRTRFRAHELLSRRTPPASLVRRHGEEPPSFFASATCTLSCSLCLREKLSDSAFCWPRRSGGTFAGAAGI